MHVNPCYLQLLWKGDATSCGFLGSHQGIIGLECHILSDFIIRFTFVTISINKPAKHYSHLASKKAKYCPSLNYKRN